MIDWKLIFNIVNALGNLTTFFNIVNALGSLATFFAFLLLLRKDEDKQSQIDKLTKVASELAQMKVIENQKLNLSVRPE